MAGEGGEWSVLDVGCGRGEFSLWARRLPGVRKVIGIDEMDGQEAGSFFPVPQHSVPLTFVKGRFDSSVRETHGPFDRIVCVDVLEHIHEDEGFLASLAECCVEGGRLILHVPATPQWHPVAAARNELKRQLLPGMGQHVREGYTGPQLTERLSAAGWRVESMRPTFGRLCASVCDIEFALSLKGKPSFPLRALLVPVAILAGWIEMSSPPPDGNGWLAVARRLPMKR